MTGGRALWDPLDDFDLCSAASGTGVNQLLGSPATARAFSSCLCVGIKCDASSLAHQTAWHASTCRINVSMLTMRKC